jgi:hypothetical protein
MAKRATNKKAPTPTLEGKRFWRSKVYINTVGVVSGEVKESDLKEFLASIPKGVEIDLNKWCITENEQKAKENLAKEKTRLAKA